MVSYKDIGFKCGLEIHKQLEGKKLFCSCPCLVNDPNKPDEVIKRNLHASAGELGDLDVAALFELSKSKDIFYEVCSTSSCLVELDEEPPHKLNEEALNTALIVAKLLNMQILPEIHFMRKVVLNGSNTTGFQRTALVAINGCIETSKGRISIPEIYLEEEAAKKISENKSSVTYKLDRLGVPLLEIKTDASIKDPEHAKEVASLIGMILNSTNRVKRGLGSIRQDINISITGHPRVEIKGFQDLKSIPKTIEIEIERQKNEIKKEILTKESLKPHVRNAEPNCTTSFLRPMPGSSRMYPETDIPIFKVTKDRLNLLEIPELITDRASKMAMKYDIQAEEAIEIIKKNIPFDYYAEKYKDPKFIAKVLIEMPKEIKKKLGNKINLSKDDFEFVFNNIDKEVISKDAAFEILSELSQDKKVDLNKYKVKDAKDVEEQVKKIIEKNKGASFNAVMGEVMKEFRGKLDNKKIVELVKRYT